MSANTPYTDPQNETTIMFNKYLGYATANVTYKSSQQPAASAIPFVPLKRLYTQDIPQSTSSFTGGNTGTSFDGNLLNTKTTYTSPNYITKYTLQLQNHPSAPGLAFYYPYLGQNLLEQGIPDNFGDGTSYNITVKNSDEVTINSNFYVYDTAAGIISFYNASTVTATLRPVITFYRYEGTLGQIGGVGDTGPTGPQGLSGDKYSTQTTSSITISPTPVDGGTGSVTVASGLSYIAGNSIIVVNSTNSDIKFNATTASYNINNGILDYKSITGVTGSFTSPDAPAVYNVSLGGVPGPNGSVGATGSAGPTGSVGPTGPSGDGLAQLNANTQGQYPLYNGSGWIAAGTNYINLGSNAGQTAQGNNSIAIGNSAGQNTQGGVGGGSAIAIGISAGQNTQGSGCIAIGNNAGNSNQAQNGGNSIAIGTNAGEFFQAGGGGSTIAIGNSAGNSNQSENSVAIGYFSGASNQGGQSVAVGFQSGQTSQRFGAVAMGNNAGQNIQGQYSVAIGYNAGTYLQGTSCIAIGNGAGQTGQNNNTIILNATGNQFNTPSGATGAFYVKPLRSNVSGSSNPLKYNSSTGEIFYDTVTPEVIQSYDITDNDFSITNKSFSKVFTQGGTINPNNIVMSINGIPQNPVTYTFGVEDVNTPTVKYVAVGANLTNNQNLAYSYDGVNWTSSSSVIGNCFGVDYGVDNSGRGKWIAGGLSAGVPILAYSWDGITWTSINTPFLVDQINSVTYGGVTSTNPLGIWIACCGAPYNGTDNNNTSTIAYSTNGGINWALAVDSNGHTFTFGTTTGNSYLQNACWNGSMWVAVGGSGDSANYPNGIAYYATSTDGITWTAYNLESYFNTYNGVNNRYSIQAKCVAWNGNMWLIGGSNWANFNNSSWRSSNQTIIYSYDGQTWTLSNAVMSYIVNDIKWNGQMWIAVGDNTNYLDQNVLSSLDGINWNALYNITNSYSCSTICYSPRQVIIGYFNTNTSGSTTGLMNYNVYMAQGTIYTSSDPRSNFTAITANLFPSNTSNTSGCQKITYMNKMPYAVTCSASGTTITQTTNLSSDLTVNEGQKLTVMSPTYYDEGIVPEVSLSFPYT